MRMKKVGVFLLGVPVCFLLAGCSPGGSLNNSTQNSNATNNTVNRTPSGNSKDGTIASMKLVHVAGQNPRIKIYDMYYWSAGKKVEAYLTEPANPGPNDYPLLVECHGGSPLPESITHKASPMTLRVVSKQSASRVTISPQYRGYAKSQGTVQGLGGDTLDTENAITAADSLPIVNPHVMGLFGGSMGGGVVLMLAADSAYQSSLSSVIAESPFVGWDITGAYALKHSKSDVLDVTRLQFAEKVYGKFSTASAAYKKRSPNISNIDAPVLLLQGTADKHVNWHTVQELYTQMKAQDKSVKLVLVPGGDHGLTHHQQTVATAIANWMKTMP